VLAKRFQPSLMKGRYLSKGLFQVVQYMVGSKSYPQTLDLAGKAYQPLAYYEKKFYYNGAYALKLPTFIINTTVKYTW
jgi:hypothetical protein